MSDTPQVMEQQPMPSEVSDSPSRQSRQGILGTIQWLLGTIIIAIFAITFVLQAFQIPTPSMEETLVVGDYLLVDKVHFANQGIWNKIEPYSVVKRGDIVVFRFPIDPKQHFVKRVIGVPGDHVRLSEKRVFVNGVQLHEPYVIHRAGTNDYRDNFPDVHTMDPETTPEWARQMRRLVNNGELVVPAGSYFVMGDNRDNSEDSRFWGFVPDENIVGRAFLVWMAFKGWVPDFSRIGSFE